MEDPDGVPDSRFWLNPIPVLAGIWVRNQQMEVFLSVSLSIALLFRFFFLI